jgi:AcrR family transcriptional regulator
VAATKRARRPRRTRDELEDILLQAASKLFSDHGFRGVTVRDIAKKAGVALPVLYRFFKDKRALYVECYFRLQVNGIRRTEMRLAQFIDPIEVLYAFTFALCERNTDFPVIRLFHYVLLDKDIPLLRKVAKVYFASTALKRVLASIESLGGKTHAYRRMLSIHSLVAGAIEHAPFWNLSQSHGWFKDDPHSVTLYVLQTIFPDVKSWERVSFRVRKKLGTTEAAIELALAG